jgi:hypothetical protein
MDKIQSITKSEMRRSLGFILLLVIVLGVSTLLFWTPVWYLWFPIVIIILGIIAYTAASKSHYLCPVCHEQFTITALQDFFAPHGITKIDGKWVEWKLLKCPKCLTRSKCYPLQENPD